MISKNEIEILAGLFPEKKFKTIKEIQKSCNYSYERIHSGLYSLKKKGILKLNKVGQTKIVTLNYGSDFGFLGFVHYAINKKIKLLRENESLVGNIKNLSKIKNTQFTGDTENFTKCISEIQNINSCLISVIEISTRPKDKIRFFCIGNKNLEDKALGIEYRYNIRIEPVVLTEKLLREKIDEPKFLNSTVLTGFEKFYNLFYLD